MEPIVTLSKLVQSLNLKALIVVIVVSVDIIITLDGLFAQHPVICIDTSHKAEPDGFVGLLVAVGRLVGAVVGVFVGALVGALVSCANTT